MAIAQVIGVPDMNDSVSRVVLKGSDYRIRFTYNDTKDFWTFGVYTDLDEPIAIGIKIIPNCEMTMFFGNYELPFGSFFCQSKLDRIGRDAFRTGQAAFLFAPLEEDEVG